MKCNYVLLDLLKAFDVLKVTFLWINYINMEFVVYHISQSYRILQAYSTAQNMKVTYVANSELKEYLSRSFSVRYGVPQDSVFGSLLLISYVNDVPYLIQGRTIMYATATSILNMKQDILTPNNNLRKYRLSTAVFLRK
jgi:hypothetical protein